MATGGNARRTLPSDWHTLFMRYKEHAYPIIAGLVVSAVAISTYVAVGTSYPGIESVNWPMAAAPPDFTTYANEASARQVWSVSVIMLVIAWITTLFVCPTLIYRCMPRHSRRAKNLALGMTTVVVVIAASVGVTIANLEFFAQDQHLGGLLESVKLESGASVELLVNWGIGLSVAAVILLFAGFSAALTVDRNAAKKESEQLGEQSQRLAWLLYVGAILLVAGTLQTWALYSWPAAMITRHGSSASESAQEEKAGDHIRNLALTKSSGLGIVLSLLLISGYVPAAMILRCRIDRLARASVDTKSGETIDQWLAKNNLTHSTNLQRVLRTAAVLGPLLAGAVLPKALKLFN